MSRRTSWYWAIAGIGVVIAIAIVASLVWYRIELQPVNPKATQPVSFQISSGTGVTTLSKQLAAQGIIKNATVFTIYVTVRGLRGELEAGTYDLYPNQSVPQIANVLSHGRISQNTLVVPEGYTVTKIRALAETKGISAADFNSALGATYANSFLAGRPAGDSSLEGYLFPDSYELSKPLRASTLIQDMLNGFGQKADQAGLTSAYAAEGLTLHQGVTVASIVEREAGKPQDQPIIAQVFLKRLQLGMKLQSDVTVDYASLLTGLPFSVSLNSPYNTYVAAGLPPGPISNPGLGALEAVAHPATTDYLYFLADKNGTVHYAQTAAEHEANVQQYLQ